MFFEKQIHTKLSFYGNGYSIYFLLLASVKQTIKIGLKLFLAQKKLSEAAIFYLFRPKTLDMVPKYENMQ